MAIGEQIHLVVGHGDHELAGVVRPGESWAAAARRTCASLHAEPVPVDLSGPVKRFVAGDDHHVTARAMAHSDLDDVTAWLHDPEVGRWWARDEEPPDREVVTARYRDRIEGRSPTRMWVVEVNARPVGFVQDYRLGDDPDDPALTAGLGPGVDPETVGVDYLIGSAAWRGRGLGPRVLWAWMLRARRRFPDASSFFAAPEHRNAASLRVLAKAGFVAGARFDETQDDGTTHALVAHTLDVATVIG